MRYLLVIIGAILFAEPNLNATLVKLSDLQTMAQKSDVVFHGHVGDQHVSYDKLGRLITLTDIEVIDNLYGTKNGQVVTMYQVGGELNGVVMPLLGGHSYRIGQEVILFGLALKDNFVSFGPGQGKLDINQGENKAQVTEDLGNVSIMGPRDAAGVTIIEPDPLSFSSTELLKDEIRLMLKNRR